MAEKVDAIRAAQSVGIIAASFAGGAIFGISQIAMPGVYAAPASHYLKVWTAVFDRGLKMNPAVAVTSGAAFAYLAYAVPRLRSLYATAAVLPVMILPYTFFFIVPTNDELHRRHATIERLRDGDPASMVQGESSKNLLVKWDNLNYIRSFMPLAGAFVGAWAALFS